MEQGEVIGIYARSRIKDESGLRWRLEGASVRACVKGRVWTKMGVMGIEVKTGPCKTPTWYRRSETKSKLPKALSVCHNR